MKPKRRRRFHKWMLRGRPGNVTLAVKRVIVRLHNAGLVVTSTTGGQHAPGSFHFSGRAVDGGNRKRGKVGANPGTPEARKLMVSFQRFLINTFECGAFLELFGPDNSLNCKNGRRITLDEGSDLEDQHDTHDHIAPSRIILLPKLPRKVLARRADKRRRASKVKAAQKHGANFAATIYDAADTRNISFPLALALFQQESNFINQYGHDRDSRGHIIWHGKSGLVRVTRENYQDYKRFRERTGRVQGVGLGQLTSAGFQILAEMRGGCWKPSANIDVSLEILAGHIKALGTFKGVGAYNGGRGNPQADYARKVLALRDTWNKRLN